MEQDCDEAEKFAWDYWHDGEINYFWA